MPIKAHAAINLNRPTFKGECKTLLEEFYTLLLQLWERHYTSPVFAGDEMIFTLGGNGYSVVFSHLGFDTLVEIKTPHGRIDLRPEAKSGDVMIAKIDSVEGLATNQMLRDFMRGIVDYYQGGPRLRV